MSFNRSFSAIFFLFLHVSSVLGLNYDGLLLLSLKYSILSEPSLVLKNWNCNDDSPCGWNDVLCAAIAGTNKFRVVSLVLPNSKLRGSIPVGIGCIEHLRHLDLSNNFFNGTIPISLFNATELENLSLSSSKLTGQLPENIGNLQQLQYLNLSDNDLIGKITALSREGVAAEIEGVEVGEGREVEDIKRTLQRRISEVYLSYGSCMTICADNPSPAEWLEQLWRNDHEFRERRLLRLAFNF